MVVSASVLDYRKYFASAKADLIWTERLILWLADFVTKLHVYEELAFDTSRLEIERGIDSQLIHLRPHELSHIQITLIRPMATHLQAM